MAGTGQSVRLTLKTVADLIPSIVLHRWSNTGDQALLLLGFKKTPVVCLFTAPVGVRQRRLSSRAEEFAGSGADGLPPQLAIQAQGTSVTVPGYSATVYILSEQQSPE
ncbi:MAG: hypothetical protein IPP12_15255 [Nitrospira sp.]|nr:hypothetical protein [Nitrospira sp.]